MDDQHEGPPLYGLGIAARSFGGAPYYYKVLKCKLGVWPLIQAKITDLQDWAVVIFDDGDVVATGPPFGPAADRAPQFADTSLPGLNGGTRL